jgi:hypothetical protein
MTRLIAIITVALTLAVVGPTAAGARTEQCKDLNHLDAATSTDPGGLGRDAVTVTTADGEGACVNDPTFEGTLVVLTAPDHTMLLLPSAAYVLPVYLRNAAAAGPSVMIRRIVDGGIYVPWAHLTNAEALVLADAIDDTR